MKQINEQCQVKHSYKITEKMNSMDHNPYIEDTRAWHTWIDINVLYDGLVNIDIERLCKYHSMKPEYYLDTLGELVEDGYLDLIGGAQ